MRTSRLQRMLLLVIMVVMAAIVAPDPHGSPVTAGTDWFSPTRIPRCNPSYDAGAPALAVDGSNLVHVAWEEDQYFLCHRFWDGAKWVPGLTDWVGQSPALTVGRDGSLNLVYSADFGGNFEIFYQRWNGTAWDYTFRVSHTSESSVHPSIAVGADGTRYVAWADNSSILAAGVSQIYFGWSPDGLRWYYAPVPSAYGDSPQLAVDGQGRVHLVWQYAETYTDPYEIFYTRCDRAPLCPDSAWTLPELVSDSRESDAVLPRLAIGRNDSVHVVWEEDAESGTRILYSTRQETAWDYPLELSSPDSSAFLPALVIDGQGNPHVVWDETADILSRTKNGGAWGPTGKVASNPNGVADVVVRPGSGLTLHAAWAQRGADDAWEIYYSRRQLAPYQVFLPILRR